MPEKSLRVGVWVGKANRHTGGGQSFPETVIAALQVSRSRHEFVRVVADHVGPRSREHTTPIRRRGDRLRSSYRSARRFLARAIRPKPTNDALARIGPLDVMYYPSPSAPVASIPSIFTVWDLAHRLFPFFPEVSYTGWQWSDRERLYEHALKRAAYIVVGTEAGKQQIKRFYGVDGSRIRVIPFPVIPVTTANA